MTGCANNCGSPAAHLHHVCYQQHVKRHGGDTSDERNFLPLCHGCHFNHHSRSKVLALSVLLDSNFDYADELLGLAAPDYLQRYYRGEDARLDALVRDRREAA